MEHGIVSTIGQKCKRCYSCIRECPAKAIKVVNGQAVVIAERCISCGHCIKVCSQNAKRTESDLKKVRSMITSGEEVFALIAPSFPASFTENYPKLPSALRKAGFKKVCETSFGADLISELYQKEILESNNKTLISSTCPAIYTYIEKYFPELTENLVCIVSPMIALGKYLKAEFGNEIKLVFIGPCIAKKDEYKDDEVAGIIDAVLTFPEVKNLLTDFEIKINELGISEFDPPHSQKGKAFPLPGGLLKSAGIPNDILEKEIIVVEGKDKVTDIINDIKSENIKAKFVDMLFCEGCISGPAIDSNLNYYAKRNKVIHYVYEKLHSCDRQIWKSNIYNARNLNLRRKFIAKDRRRPMPSEEKIAEILLRSNKITGSDELNCSACGYKTCREYAIAISKGLAEDDMCLPYLIEKLKKAYDDLKNTKDQLHTAEKLASIGELAAGVAHEINNPLGSIMLYAELLKKNLGKISDQNTSKEDLQFIIEEANRCKSIVANLLNFARQGSVNITKFNFEDFVKDIIKTLKINPIFAGVNLKVNNISKENIFLNADKSQLKQVFTNLLSNAAESLEENKEKLIQIEFQQKDQNIEISVKDNGCGIPKENISKIFTPFFTTKKIGKGTGLGLAISYGIIKMHKGEIEVYSLENTGTEVKIKIPINNN